MVSRARLAVAAWVALLSLPATAASPEAARLALAKGRWAEAAQRLEHAVAEAPADGERWLDLGLARAELGDPAAALAAWSRAADVLATDPEPLRRIGDLHLRAGRWSEAAQVLRRARALAPEDVGLMAGLSRALQARGDWSEALPLQRELVARSPEDRAARLALVDCLEGTGAHGEAGDVLAGLLVQHRQEAGLWMRLGAARAAAGEPEAAAVAWEQATRVAPERSDAWRELGWAWSETGRWGWAMDALQRAGRLSPATRAEIVARLMARDPALAREYARRVP